MAGRNLVPDWVPFVGTRNKMDYWLGKEGASEDVLSSDSVNNWDTSKEWLPGEQSSITGSAPYQVADQLSYGMLPSGVKPSEAIVNPVAKMWNWMQPGGGFDSRNEPADKYANIRKFRDNIDFEDKESIKELQGYLGVDQDGMFGPQTEEAWRKAVAGMDVSDGKEALRYDWNQKMLDDRVQDSRFKLGGLLKQAYTGLDEKIGGVLPGGYRKDKANMTAEEFYGK